MVRGHYPLKCPDSPRSRSTACRRIGRSTSKHSSTAFGDPGKLTIRVVPAIPAMPRESIAIGVFDAVSRRIASAIPGVSRRTTARVASGVLSRAAKPVPPVVRTRSMPSFSTSSTSLVRISSVSSVTIERSTTRAPISPSKPARRLPDASVSGVRVSLTVRTAALIGLLSVIQRRNSSRSRVRRARPLRPA